MSDQEIKHVHSTEEILTSILMEIRCLIARSKRCGVPEDESRRMLSIARSAYDYLIVMLTINKSSQRTIGTSLRELRYLESETNPVPIKTAQQLFGELVSQSPYPWEE